jgi:hypothetical protein
LKNKILKNSVHQSIHAQNNRFKLVSILSYTQQVKKMGSVKYDVWIKCEEV